MPGQYPIGGGFRPRLCDEGKQADATPRLYLCARCRVQVLICSCCDRGNIYCKRGCAKESRCSKQRASGQRYRSSIHRTRNAGLLTRTRQDQAAAISLRLRTSSPAPTPLSLMNSMSSVSQMLSHGISYRSSSDQSAVDVSVSFPLDNSEQTCNPDQPFVVTGKLHGCSLGTDELDGR